MSQPITLPRWLQGTRTMQFSSLDVALVMGMVLFFHGTPAAVRQAAANMRDKVCMEHRPKMRLLAREKDDAKAMAAAINIATRVTNLLGIMPGEPFPVRTEIELVAPPRCHMKPMRLAGYHEHRHWKCQHCTHTKPLEVPHGQASSKQ